MKKIVLIGLLSSFALSCTKDDKPAPTPPAPGTPTPSVTAAKTFEGLTFNRKTAFFSTDGTMTKPVDSVEGKTIVSKIDITFTYNYDYGEAGFFDPVSRSKKWYWEYDYSPWLSAGVETKYYYTELTKAEFDLAKADDAKIAGYMAAASVEEAPHLIYPTGSCIGGRETSGDQYLLKKGRVFGFKNVVSGKRGFIYVRTDQSSLWPDFEENTRVDIIRER